MHQVIDLEKENKEILREYRKLLRHAKPMLKDGDAKRIKKAFNTAVEAHKDMRRKSGEPYIFHPIAVAQICVEEIGLGPTSIIAALLHDVVEDTEYELEDIRSMFGDKVVMIIDGLTKISGVFEYGTSQQAENFRKMVLTLSEDLRVILIKLADRLHNMRTLDSMPRHKQLKIASETIYLYAPLAHRLGLYAIKSELEDLYLKYTDPDTYYFIAKKINQSKDKRNKFIKDFIQPIKKQLDKFDFTCEIKGRPKSIYSIWNKMKNQNIPFEEVYDLFAIRIIIDTPTVNEKTACWQVYSIITDNYRPNPDRLRDWISTPKSNGYESLHTTVMSNSGKWVEVQIRTHRMDDIAEKGYAAHWKYKDVAASQKAEAGLDQWVNKVRSLMESNNADAVEFIDEFRSNLFQEEVFVFTPKGDLRVLPNGATALDFAFEIHSQIGLTCLGAKVNHKLVPLTHQLKNGDQVEVLTSHKQKPSEDWLKIVRTSKARKRIKDYLKESKKKVVEDGEAQVHRKLKSLGIDLTDDVKKQMLNYYRADNLFDFYYRVGNGAQNINSINRISDVEIKKAPAINNKKANKKLVIDNDGIKKINKSALLIGDDMDDVEYSFAKCCNPIPGDDVFGFVTIHDGIKIHRANCPNATELMSNYGYRIVKAQWAEHTAPAFLVGLKITGTDRVGLINDITNILSKDHRINIRSINASTDDGIVEDRLMIYVQDKSHLDRILKSLKEIPGILNVDRIDPEN